MKDLVMLFAFGLILLIKGGDWFVDGATAIARKFRLPEILIGATVVSIGTTLPEVMVSASGAMGGMGAMAYGNAIGSIICNTSLIAAITIAVKPGKADKKAIVFPVCFFFGAAVFYAANAYIFEKFSRVAGIILLAGFVVYMVTLVLQMMKKPLEPESVPLEITDSEFGDGKLDPDEVDSIVKPIVFLILGAAVIAVGADLLVENGTKIAETLGVPQTVIALTFVALGTSLPELVTAITSLAKGHGALSLGNIIGANLFNLVLVSGVAISINPFDVPSAATIAGMNASFVLDIPVMFAVMALMTLPVIFRGKLSRWQGITLLCIYAAYCTMQFVMPLMA
jgi:cation:H+ antiporter